MKEIFGGSFLWERCLFIFEVNGRRIVVLVFGMLYVGVDGVFYN